MHPEPFGLTHPEGGEHFIVTRVLPLQLFFFASTCEHEDPITLCALTVTEKVTAAIDNKNIEMILFFISLFVFHR
jgi:hypothetical protein